MAICLLLTCLLVPFSMAFSDELDLIPSFILFMYIIDIFFSVDILIIFNTAIVEDDSFDIVDDRKKIALIYMKSWFLIDLLSVVPFDIIFESLIPQVEDATDEGGTSRMN